MRGKDERGRGKENVYTVLTLEYPYIFAYMSGMLLFFNHSPPFISLFDQMKNIASLICASVEPEIIKKQFHSLEK